MRALWCVLLLAGCYDFSRYSHLPDGAPGTNDDLAGINGGGPGVLINEPFDTFDTTLWSIGMAQRDAFSIDTSTKVEGTGSLRIDVQELSAFNLTGLGEVFSQIALPQDLGPRTLRFYARYDGETDKNVDVGTLAYPKGAGAAITLSPVGATTPSSGAYLVLNDYADSKFQPSSIRLHDDGWHCFELSTVPVNGNLTLEVRLDNAVVGSVGMSATSIMAPLYSVGVGFGIAQTPQMGTRTAWVDAVMLTATPGPIGCPYPIGS